MYRDVYHNPYNRAKEAFMKRITANEKIPLDTMLSWMDWQFEDWFKMTFGESEYRKFFHIYTPKFEEIGREYNLSKLEETRNTHEKGGVIVERLKPPRDATKNLVLHSGNVVWLDSIPEFEERVQGIRKIITDLNYVGIYREVA